MPPNCRVRYAASRQGLPPAPMGAPGQGALRPPGPPGLRPQCRLRGTGPCHLSIDGEGVPFRAIWFFGPVCLRKPPERPAAPLSRLSAGSGVGHPKKKSQTAVFHGFAIWDLVPAFLREKFQKEIGQLERGQAARLVHRRASVPLQRRRWADLGTDRTGGCPPWVGSEVVHGQSGLPGAAGDHPHFNRSSKSFFVCLFISLFLCLLCYNFSSS